MKNIKTVRLTDNKLDTYINNGLNVLLIGEKGVGKSERIFQAFKRNNLKYVYFSGATIDPFIHLIGVPQSREIENKQVLDFILPKDIDNDMEAIFIDEFNRSPKLVRNALMELIQFKSINGRKFKNLKCIFTAINPPSEDEDITYDVDEIDEAQLDRFHIIIKLPNKPDKSYFTKKYGKYRGEILIDWWNEQSENAKKIISPRRLDYVGELFNKGIDISEILPVNSNINNLINELSKTEEELSIEKVLQNPTAKEFENIFSDDSNYMKYKNKINSEKFFDFYRYLNKEYIVDALESNKKFRNYIKRSKDKIYIELLKEIEESSPEKFTEYFGNKEDREYIKNIKLPVSTGHSTVFINDYRFRGIKASRIDPNTYQYFTTNDNRQLISIILDSWENLIKDGYAQQVLAFLLRCYNSFQRSTIKNIDYFEELLILFASNVDSPNKNIFDYILTLKPKIEKHDLLIEIIENGC